jgi:hypothetical protein
MMDDKCRRYPGILGDRSDRGPLEPITWETGHGGLPDTSGTGQVASGRTHVAELTFSILNACSASGKRKPGHPGRTGIVLAFYTLGAELTSETGPGDRVRLTSAQQLAHRCHGAHPCLCQRLERLDYSGGGGSLSPRSALAWRNSSLVISPLA